ncbi:hypothetical protein [Leuconostoc pseudomesenteroides]|uniref:hypothetical protein n=1 Tax=Leuconostoc pseudomesenteroides TaxID=33968 RepID=UPI00228602E4|nr:hypothetical protein [Leuconostoc pseudomesenteroides]WAM38495.1 hypothetical protein OYT93_09945 [Leuconostoc pseudomesenteroides]
MTGKIVNKVVGALVVFLAISPLSTAFADKSISYDNDVKTSKSYTMDNGKQINISDQNIEHDDGNSKGDTSPAIEGNKDISLINTDDYLLIPHTNGKWEKIDKSDLFNKAVTRGNGNQVLMSSASGGVVVPNNAWDKNKGHVALLQAEAWNYAQTIKLYSAMKAAVSSSSSVGVIITTLLSQVPECGCFLSMLGGLDAVAFNQVCSEYRNAADKTTDRGFGLVTTNMQNPMGQTVNPYLHDWFYNDSWDTPSKALSVPDGSDSRTPNNWPGGLSFIGQDFYGGWSCDYNSAAKWVGVGKASKY